MAYSSLSDVESCLPPQAHSMITESRRLSSLSTRTMRDSEPTNRIDHSEPV